MTSNRIPLSFRTTPAIRAKVEASAAKSGRSVAQELEYLLELSFAREDWERQMLGVLAVAVQNMPENAGLDSLGHKTHG